MGMEWLGQWGWRIKRLFISKLEWLEAPRQASDFESFGSTVDWYCRTLDLWMGLRRDGVIESSAPIVLFGDKRFKQKQTTLAPQFFGMHLVDFFNKSRLWEPKRWHEQNGQEHLDRAVEKFRSLARALAEEGALDLMEPQRLSVRHGQVILNNSHHAQRPLLHHAIGYDNRGWLPLWLVEELLDFGADPNKADAYGVVPLNLLAHTGQDKQAEAFRRGCAMALLGKGADLGLAQEISVDIMGGVYSMMASPLAQVAQCVAYCTPLDYWRANDPDLEGYVRSATELSQLRGARAGGMEQKDQTAKGQGQRL